MIRVVAFDLDNTLLDLAPGFIPHYLAALEATVGPRLRERGYCGALSRDIMRSTETLFHQPPGEKTLEVRFWEDFCVRCAIPYDVLAPWFASFYREDFRLLANHGRPVPGSIGLLATLDAHGIRTAVLTNPVFPRVAIRERLAWAGLADVPFSWVSALEEARAPKPHTAFYEEALGHLEVRPQECLMVGDDWENDIVPARAIGMPALWVGASTAPGALLPPGVVQGSLYQVLELVSAT